MSQSSNQENVKRRWRCRRGTSNRKDTVMMKWNVKLNSYSGHSYLGRLLSFRPHSLSQIKQALRSLPIQLGNLEHASWTPWFTRPSSNHRRRSLWSRPLASRLTNSSSALLYSSGIPSKLTDTYRWWRLKTYMLEALDHLKYCETLQSTGLLLPDWCWPASSSFSTHITSAFSYNSSPVILGLWRLWNSAFQGNLCDYGNHLSCVVST